MAVLSEFLLKRRYQSTILLIEGTHSAKVLVMFRDLQHSFARDRLTAQHIFQKGHDFVGPLRPSEGNYQDCVVKLGHETVEFLSS
jgi:hypothetical protein